MLSIFQRFYFHSGNKYALLKKILIDNNNKKTDFQCKYVFSNILGFQVFEQGLGCNENELAFTDKIQIVT